MNKTLEVSLSALTAFCITAGGSLVVVAGSNGSGALNKTAWLMSLALGLIAAAKDVRSLLKLPPVVGGIPGGTAFVAKPPDAPK